MASPPQRRPPSVDRLARSMVGVPHPVAVLLARQAIADGATDPAELTARVAGWRQSMLTPVINATGVLLHTNLGRAPLGLSLDGRPTNLELDLATGQRGSRQRGIGALFAALCGAEAAMVVNNNAAAVLLVCAALAAEREVLVSRGESVEIGGEFRIPEVIAASGARLVDVGTTNRTRLGDYRRSMARRRADVAMILKVHPSNYRIEGFTESTSVADLAQLVGQPPGVVPASGIGVGERPASAAVELVVDVGSGLLDANCPWLPGPPPAWLADEPAVRQTLQDGAALVTFSGDKLFGGPQAGIIVGRADLVERCARHPLARALRPGGLVLAALSKVAEAYLRRTTVAEVPWWRMASADLGMLRARAAAVIARAGVGMVIDSEALPGAGSAPGRTIPSVAVSVEGDCTAALRAAPIPVIARAVDGRTVLDLRSVEPTDDAALSKALHAATFDGGRHR